MSMAKIGVISLGCAKNQVNCEQMMYRLQEAGHEILPDVTGADVVLINTCGFIDSAKSEAIDHIIAMGQLKEAGVAPALIRLSVGIETPEDILADISQALEKATH